MVSLYKTTSNKVGFTKPTLFIFGIVMSFYDLLFTSLKIPNRSFYGFSSDSLFTQGKSRHCGLDPQSQELTYATPYQVRGDILEIWVHQRLVLVQFGYSNFQPIKIGKGWIDSSFRSCNDEKYFRASWIKKYRKILPPESFICLLILNFVCEFGNQTKRCL